MTNASQSLIKWASILFYLLALVTIGFGALYFFRTDIMAYHYAYLGIDHAALVNFNPKLLGLMVDFMKIIGSSYIGLGLYVLLNTFFGIRKLEKWAWWSSLILTLPLVTTYIITLIVSNGISSGPKPPSYLALILILLLIAGLALSFKPIFKK